ncbi:exodeoxyribonuclease V subunit gamma [Actinobacillus equuli]|nr:exodeoxyribonuclease V subunit gamma [Actinobacillus equuli]
MGIRAGLTTEQQQWQNYNSWQNGLTRLLLGTSLKEENGIWQEAIGFNESYGLASELVGYLCHYLENLVHGSNLSKHHTALVFGNKS